MDGTVSAQVLAGNGHTVSVADDEPPPDPAVAACADAPTVTVADAEARRGDDHPNLGVNLTKCLSLTTRAPCRIRKQFPAMPVMSLSTDH